MKKKSSLEIALRPRFRIDYGDDIALGPGKAELLDHVNETGSISEAARRMDMSYNRAWLLIRTINHCFKKPVVLALRGGTKGGGAQLSDTGKRALALYHRLEEETLRATEKTWQEIQSLLK